MSFRFRSSFVSLCIIVWGLCEGSFVTRFAALCSRVCARSRSVLNFLASLGLVVSVVFESSSSVWGAHRILFPYLFPVVSCSYLVLDARLCFLCLHLVGSVGGHLLSLSCCCPLFRPGYLVGPLCLLSCPLDYYLFVCRTRCFSVFVLSLSMSYLQLWYVQK